MNATFTPGPWEVGGPYPSVTVITMVDAGCGWPEPEPPQYEPIAYVHNGAPNYDKPPPPVAVANARLIAAAPDMLSALDDVLADRMIGLLSEETRQSVRHAIEKAEGRTP